MEANTICHLSPFFLKPPIQRGNPFLSYFPRSVGVKASSSSSELQGRYRGPKPKKDWLADWVFNNDGAVRSLPIYVGGLSLLAVLFNRTVSGVAPVADASKNPFSSLVKKGGENIKVIGGEKTPSGQTTCGLILVYRLFLYVSSQSRTDILTIALAVTNLFTGLVWLSIRPKYVSAVNPEGVECKRINLDFPDSAVAELLWAWESLADVTCCRSLVIVHENTCLLQIGVASESSTKDGNAVFVDTTKLIQGSLYQGVIRSRKQSYLANLSLYPGRSELFFLPSNTQAVILQPLGESGIIIIGGDTIRGFTAIDQAWITLISEKLDATFSKLRKATPLAAQ